MPEPMQAGKGVSGQRVDDQAQQNHGQGDEQGVEQIAAKADPCEHVRVVLPAQVGGKEAPAGQADQHFVVRLKAGKDHEQDRRGIEQRGCGDKEGEKYFSHGIDSG